MAKKMDLGALRQQIMELQIDKELKHDLLEVINEKKHYGLVWEESSEAAWDWRFPKEANSAGRRR